MGFEHGAVIEPAVTLAANLRRYRERAHLSQEALAYAADLHPNAIGFLERGLHDPKLETLLAIASPIQRALTTGNLQLIEAVASGRTTPSTSNVARVIYERPSA